MKFAQVSKALAARRERVEQAIQQKDEIDAAANPRLRELGASLSFLNLVCNVSHLSSTRLSR
jgi:hypothetical protein